MQIVRSSVLRRAAGALLVAAVVTHPLAAQDVASRVATGSPGAIVPAAAPIQWTSGSAFPVALDHHVTFVTSGSKGDYLHVIGGHDGGRMRSTAWQAKIGRDGSIGAWEQGQALPAERAGMAFASDGRYAILAGGKSTTKDVAQDVFVAHIWGDGRLGAWKATPFTLPAKRFHTGAVIANGYVYVIGGNDGTSATRTVFRAKIDRTGTLSAWTTLDSLPGPRSHQAAFVHEGAIWLVAGIAGNPMGDAKPLGDVLRAEIGRDGALGEWKTVSQLDTPFATHAAVVHGGFLYVIGGVEDNAKMSDRVLRAALTKDGSLGAWESTASPLPAARAHVHQVPVLRDHLFSIGGSRSGRALDDELSTAEALALVEQMAALGVREITLIGGEAYLHPGFLDVARAITSHGMHCSVTTGGRALDESLAQAMAAAGVVTASVSVDGDELAHDRIRRQKGSHGRALSAIRALKRAGLRPSINTQVNRWSFASLGAVVDMMVSEGARAWMPIITVPMGRGADQVDMLFQPYQLVDVVAVLAEHASRARAAGILVTPGNNVGYFGPHEHVLRSEFAGKYGGSCGAGRTTMGVEADGNIKSCPGLPTDAYSSGFIRDHALETLWERGRAMRYTRERTVDDLWGFCRTCYYADVCMAGCTWTSHVILGRPGNNPYCYHRAATLREQGKRERLVPMEAPRGVPFDHGSFRIELEDIPTREGTS